MKIHRRFYTIPCLAIAMTLASISNVSADTIRITVESRAPENGVSFTPVWIGTHDGSFDLFNEGEAANGAIEKAAEDGDFGALREWYQSSVNWGVDLVVTGPENPGTPPLFFPQTTNYQQINLDATNPNQRYLSFFAMLLPSNDAFFANNDPMMIPIFDENGNFIGGEYAVMGNHVYDAGTEINDEVAANVPLLGQTVANSGTTENGVISNHSGFTPGGPIQAAFPNTLFDSADYGVFYLKIERIPEDHTTIELRVKNYAASQGTLLTPFWFGLHNGSFDLFNPDYAVSPIIERVAEDGNPAPLVEAFNSSTFDAWNGVLTGPQNPDGPPLFFPGQQNSLFINIDANNPSHSYLSYLAMILPSNDAFIGNAEPMAHQIADKGAVMESDIWITGAQVWDAGTEVNDETPSNVPVLGQQTPDTGTTEDGVATQHPGFNDGGAILSMFPNADFTKENYKVAKISVIHRFNPWEGIPLNPDGLRDSPTFGIVDDSGYPWLQHRHHGSLFIPEGGNMEGFWLYNSQGDFGWLFTSANYYPRVYRLEDNTWYQYQERTSNPRLFENMANGEIVEFE